MVMMHCLQDPTADDVGRSRAFSLVELLVCLAIVVILTGLALVGYRGSFDGSDLNGVLPQAAGDLTLYHRYAKEGGSAVVVEFVEGENTINVTSGPASNRITSTTGDFVRPGLLKRRFAFRGYAWPDGAKTPRTFTFYPNGKIDGGIVRFGSSFAEGSLFPAGDRIDWSR